MGTDRNTDFDDIAGYFEQVEAGIEVIEDGLNEMPFGEYLVEKRALTRGQLMAALIEQERHPSGVALGDVIAWMGYMPYSEVDRMLTEWSSIPVVEIV